MNSDAHVYGLSMFSLACDEGLEKEILDELKTAAALFKENAGYSSLLDSPAVSLDERLSLRGMNMAQFWDLFVPALSIACSKLSVVSTPKITGTSVSKLTLATPLLTSAQT